MTEDIKPNFIPPRVRDLPVVRPHVDERPVPERRAGEFSDVALAEASERLRGLGLDTGQSTVVQARLMRIGTMVQELQTLVSPDQFSLLIHGLKRRGGDLEVPLAALLAAARSGTLFKAPVEAAPASVEETRGHLPGFLYIDNRKGRRRKQKRRSRKS